MSWPSPGSVPLCRSPTRRGTRFARADGASKRPAAARGRRAARGPRRARASRGAVEALAGDDRPHYGVSTGFGALATRHIPVPARAHLQRSLIRSHSAGSGPEVEREVVRALMLLRLSTLATGRTGVRVETARAYANLLSAGITPVVHEHGSLGCSGDLAPLAHVALALLGEGDVHDADGHRRPAARGPAREREGGS